MLIEGPPGPAGPAVGLLSKKILNKHISHLFLNRFPGDIHIHKSKQKRLFEFWIFFSKGLPGPAGLQGPPGTAGDPGERVSVFLFFFNCIDLANTLVCTG